MRHRSLGTTGVKVGPAQLEGCLGAMDVSLDDDTLDTMTPWCRPARR